MTSKLNVKFSLQHTSDNARAGLIETDHGRIETPIFMPVGTQGSVKALTQAHLESLGAEIILGNTYHLYLRPGTEVLESQGGLHRFMDWHKPILTDSGGYQVFSLSELRTVREEGVEFRSHLDGSKHFFTPRSVVDIQRAIGSDIMMALDECPPYPCDVSYAKRSMDLTIRWTSEARKYVQDTSPLYNSAQAFFAIVQGSIYPELRTECAKKLIDLDCEGYAIGGLAVGEPIENMYDIVAHTANQLPQEKPRYLMGVGTPENILEAIERGIDMFDCVMPTRNARNAQVFTRSGKINLRNAKYKTDDRPIDREATAPECLRYSRSYLRHLFVANEIAALTIATMHNIAFYLWLVRQARKHIRDGNFSIWKKEMISSLRNEEPA